MKKNEIQYKLVINDTKILLTLITMIALYYL